MRVFYPAARAILTVYFDGFRGADGDSTVFPVLPRTLRVHRNSYRQADSWEMKFAAADLPIDPRLLRAGQAEIYLFDRGGIDDTKDAWSRQAVTGTGEDAIRRAGTRNGLEALEKTEEARNRITFGNAPLCVGTFDDQSYDAGEDGRWVT